MTEMPRLFNRVYTIAQKLPKVGLHPDLDAAGRNRTFSRLPLIQFLSDRLGVGRSMLRPAVMKGFPAVPIVPVYHMRVPARWQENPLWATG